MNRPLFFILFAAVLALTGCRTFHGNIAFESENETKVWVADVEGFKRPPPVGILGTAGGKYSRMDPMPLPEEVTIHWSFEWYRSDHSTKVSLKDVAIPGQGEELLFTFTKDGNWRVGIKQWK